MRSLRIGEARITRVEEVLERGFKPSFLFPDLDRDALFERHPQLAQANFYDAEQDRLMSSIHSWLIRIGGKIVLVDTCSGNGKTRALPLFARFHMLDFPYLDNLAAAGVRPEEVDYVFCTHLHIDHVGWNTRRDGEAWVPTFPNARYLFGRTEYDHWVGGNGPAIFPENVAVIEDSVMPVVAAGLVQLVDDGDEILPGLTVQRAPGHTEGHMALKYTSPDGSFIVTGDCMHQPIQIYAPEINSCFCEKPEEARRTRRAILDWCADEGALLMPIHFGWPHAGFVRRDGAGYRFEPIETAAG